MTHSLIRDRKSTNLKPLTKFLAFPHIMAVPNTPTSFHSLAFIFTSDASLPWATGMPSLPQRFYNNVYDCLYALISFNNWKENFLVHKPKIFEVEVAIAILFSL